MTLKQLFEEISAHNDQYASADHPCPLFDDFVDECRLAFEVDLTSDDVQDVDLPKEMAMYWLLASLGINDYTRSGQRRL